MLKPFFVRHNKVLKSIRPQDVMILYTEANYTKVVLSDNSYYLVRSTLSSALKKLPHDMFIKTHRSFAVSILFIDIVDRDHVIVNGETVPLSRQYYKQVIGQLDVME